MGGGRNFAKRRTYLEKLVESIQQRPDQDLQQLRVEVCKAPTPKQKKKKGADTSAVRVVPQGAQSQQLLEDGELEKLRQKYKFVPCIC